MGCIKTTNYKWSTKDWSGTPMLFLKGACSRRYVDVQYVLVESFLMAIRAILDYNRKIP
jgi:hypothetical protein